MTEMDSTPANPYPTALAAMRDHDLTNTIVRLHSQAAGAKRLGKPHAASWWETYAVWGEAELARRVAHADTNARRAA